MVHRIIHLHFIICSENCQYCNPVIRELSMLQSTDHHDNIQSGSLACHLPFTAFLPVVELTSTLVLLKTVFQQALCHINVMVVEFLSIQGMLLVTAGQYSACKLYPFFSQLWSRVFMNTCTRQISGNISGNIALLPFLTCQQSSCRGF